MVGAALRPARFGDIGDEGADQAALVDAVVQVEPLVLGGDEGALHGFGNLVERHPDAVLVGFKQLGELVALAVEHDAGAGQLEVPESVVIGQVGGDAVVEFDHRSDVEARAVERVLAAKLLVGSAEVIEVDAAERSHLAGDGLRIGHCGVDQLVEVEVFDVERLAHVRAAVLEKLYDRGLIGDRIELGLEMVRARRHLRQRQRSGKHLDQNEVHRA
jgi:hypothetical protein